jgi:serine/threonine protein kinase
VGGMAEVFLAKSFGAAGFERLLVIKKILPHLAEDEEFITMFIDEARIASTLTHSNIIQINELGKEDNDYYIAMEYMMAKDLSRIHEKISRQKRAVPIPIVVLIASRICEGLEYAHRKKDSDGKSLDIIHRDISPGNVLVSYDGDVKLIDFGIAKAQNRMGRTTAGTLKGKFGYMSPEQVRGMPLDHRSDIFSVGILVYELLTGERLFGAESDFGTLEKVRNAQVEPPTTYNSKIPAELERVVMQALARDPEERYDWASDMQEDLVRFLMQDGSLTTSKSLAAFMRDMFKRELKKENERLSLYRKRGYPWLDAARGDDPQAAKQTMEMAVVTGEEAEQDEEAPPAMADDVPDMSEDEEGHLAERKPEPEPESVVDKDRARVQGPSDTEEMLSADALADAATQVFSMEDIEAAEEAVAAQTGENSAPGDSQPSDSVQVNMGDEQVHQPTMILPDGLASIEGSEDENTPGGDAKGSLDASSVEVEE